MFSLAFLKPIYKVLSAESCCGGDTPASVNQLKSPIKKPMFSFNKSFISSGKQGGLATALGEGRDIGTRETCLPTSLNINNLGKAAVLHLASRSLQVLIGC
jgi:hypothetical protein